MIPVDSACPGILSKVLCSAFRFFACFFHNPFHDPPHNRLMPLPAGPRTDAVRVQGGGDLSIGLASGVKLPDTLYNLLFAWAGAKGLPTLAYTSSGGLALPGGAKLEHQHRPIVLGYGSRTPSSPWLSRTTPGCAAVRSSSFAGSKSTSKLE